MNSSKECEVLKSGREEQTSTLLPSLPPPPTTPLSLILDSDTEWLMMVTADASGNRLELVENFGFTSDNYLRK